MGENDTTERLTDHLARGFIDRVEESRYDQITLDELEGHALAIKWIPKNAAVLDVGCGSGNLAKHLQDLGCNVVGVEPNRARADAAAAKGVKVLCEFLDQDLVARIAPVDVVLFMDVLEHLPDPVALLEIAKSALKPSGAIIISVPNVAHWTVRTQLLAGRFKYEATGIMDATHLRWFTSGTVRDVAKAAVLEVAEQAVSRGTWMPHYRQKPWTMLNESKRRRLINQLCMMAPSLFGCQHIAKLVRPRIKS